MKKFCIAITSILLLMASMVASAANMRIGVINYSQPNLNQALRLRMTHLVQNQIGDVTQALKNSKTKLLAAENKLKNKGSALSETERTQLKADIAAQQKAMQNQTRQLMKKERSAQLAARNQIMKHLENVLSQIAKKENLTMVLNSASVAYTQNKVDVTDQAAAVIKQENSRHKNNR